MAENSRHYQGPAWILVSLSVLALAIWLYNRDFGAVKAAEAPFNPELESALAQARSLRRTGNLVEAAEILHVYSEAGHPEAMYNLGRAYSRGWGVPKDLDLARQWQLRAVTHQTEFRGKIAYELGRIYQRSAGDDCSQIAFEWFLNALDWKHDKAHMQLARHYERGLGVEQDIARAVFHYEAAAKAGYASAALKYATLLTTGDYGVPLDLARAQAITTSTIAALETKVAAGSSTAAKQLGRLYRDGVLVPQDLPQAINWFRRGAQLNDPGSMHDLANLMLATLDTPDKHREALDWLQSAAQLDHGGAMTALGRLHIQQAYGLERAGAVAWFQKGVQAKHPGAMEELARLKAQGELTDKDVNGALELAQRGADMGHRGSRSVLQELLGQANDPESQG